jgi:type III secretion protein W
MSSPKIPHISAGQAARLSMLHAEKANLLNRAMRQIAVKEGFQQWAEQGFDGIAKKDFRSLEEQHKRRYRVKSAEDKGLSDDSEVVEEIHPLEDAAAQYEKRNPELKMQALILLRNQLSMNDTADDILQKVLKMYPDYSLADEALEFLLDTTGGALQTRVREAREQFYQKYEREIKAGRNIAVQAREFAEQGLGQPTALRDMYRDITGNPRDPHALFDELFSEYSYAKMKTVIDFLLHSLGADLKSKGPSISRTELQLLMEDARNLLAILGVYRFFKERMRLIESQFVSYDLVFPLRITFELLAKQFLALVGQRYVSSEKILKLARNLEISETLAAQIIIFTQMRDAIRQIAPRLYRNQRHKDEILHAFLETLEEIEEQYYDNEEE